LVIASILSLPDRATALALLEELQNRRRNVTRLQMIVDEIAQLVTSTT